MDAKQKAALHDVHSMVSNTFIGNLQNDIIPWHQSWHEHPQNLNGWPFDHINVWLLAALRYSRNIFVTQKQINRLKLSVKQGERGHTIVGIRHGYMRPTFYCLEVYNIEQLNGIYEELLPSRNEVRDSLQKCETIVSKMPKFPTIIWDPAPSFYNLLADTILIRRKECFDSDAQFYSSLFYFLAQCTGHQKRRNRSTAIPQRRSDPKLYCCEQLIIEMAAGYLCSFAGITPWYLSTLHAQGDEWIRQLQADPTLAITAAMFAQEAVNYILNRSPRLNPIQTGVYLPKGTLAA